MPNFSYKALGRDGKEVRGVLQAESEAAAASRIRENYPILLSISQKKEKKRPDDGSLLEMEIGSRRIKTKKLAILCSQFAITLHSGMTVARAMRMLAAQNEDKRIRKIMGAAAEEVAAGSTVASALESIATVFRSRLSRRSGQASSPVHWNDPLTGFRSFTKSPTRRRRRSRER